MKPLDPRRVKGLPIYPIRCCSLLNRTPIDVEFREFDQALTNPIALVAPVIPVSRSRVEPLHKRLRTKSSSVPDSAAPTSKSAGRTQRDRKQRASESSPAASAEQLPQGLAQTLTTQQRAIDLGDVLDDNWLEEATVP